MSFGAFESFLQGWMVRQEHYCDELLSAQQYCHESTEDYLKELISRILLHYQQYYQQKSKAAQRNVFLVFSPTWLTSLERTFLWIAGFKPTLAFKLISRSVNDLSEDQSGRLKTLSEETRFEERTLNSELASIQESVAAPPLIESARQAGRRLINRQVQLDEPATESLRLAMESVLARADLLRTTTAEKVVEILSPAQNVKFLAAATQLQLKIRSLGLQMDAGRPESHRRRP